MTSARSRKLCLAQQADADEILSRDPFALLVGMLLDQQIPMERAFAGPAMIAPRMDGPFDPSTVASYDPDGFVEIVAGPPAVHRFPSAMAARVQTLAKHLDEQYGGNAVRRLGRRKVRGRPARPAVGAARVRRAEGEDLRRAAR